MNMNESNNGHEWGCGHWVLNCDFKQLHNLRFLGYFLHYPAIVCKFYGKMFTKLNIIWIIWPLSHKTKINSLSFFCLLFIRNKYYDTIIVLIIIAPFASRMTFIGNKRCHNVFKKCCHWNMEYLKRLLFQYYVVLDSKI